MKVPLHVEQYEAWDGAIIRRIMDEKNNEVARGEDGNVLREIANAVNAANESEAIANTRAKYQAALDHAHEEHEKTRQLLSDEIAETRKAYFKMKEQLEYEKTISYNAQAHLPLWSEAE